MKWCKRDASTIKLNSLNSKTHTPHMRCARSNEIKRSADKQHWIKRELQPSHFKWWDISQHTHTQRLLLHIKDLLHIHMNACLAVRACVRVSAPQHAHILITNAANRTGKRRREPELYSGIYLQREKKRPKQFGKRPPRPRFQNSIHSEKKRNQVTITTSSKHSFARTWLSITKYVA